MSEIHFKQPASREDYIDLIRKLGLKPPVIIKPNWGTSVCFTEAEIIDWTLEAIDGEAVIVESYGWARTEEALRTGKLGSKKKGDLRESDEWFIKHSGMDKVLEKHGVEFINISEENWAGRTVDPEIVRKQIESMHDPVMRDELYGVIPERLYELRHGDLLSLSKVKLWQDAIGVSFTIKNLFGMIPDPSRMKYHGKGHKDLPINIVDIFKIYDSIFNIKGVVEAIKTASLHDPDAGKTCIYPDPEFVAVSKNPLELDAACATMVGLNPSENLYLNRVAETFGDWSSGVDVLRNSGVRVPR
jgi:uncharacterized protein (DUF362 family)